jgi:hypothetical protein
VAGSGLVGKVRFQDRQTSSAQQKLEFRVPGLRIFSGDGGLQPSPLHVIVSGGIISR